MGNLLIDAIVYLLHFAAPVGNPENSHGQAQHYLGTANDLEARYHKHITGQGSPLVKAAVDQDIPVEVVRTWCGGRLKESQLKGQHNNKRLCPKCNPKGWNRRGND